ncbi:MAG TPA: hypothetical protein VFX22_01265 [Candidatus Kapabacteria bacterium]|nr:hypothetical protein [Candidatus Kapabacteria bacterium]
MKTKRVLIAIILLCGFAWTVKVEAQDFDRRGFGMGLIHSDSAETIAYIARESPLHDVNAVIGDAIVAIAGRAIKGNDIILNGMFKPGVDSVTVLIRHDTSEFSATLYKTRLRACKMKCCGMLDNQIAFLRLTAFNEDNVEQLESMLDSLVTGNNGYGNTIDVAEARQTEARQVFFRQNPGFIVRGVNEIEGYDPGAFYRGQIDSYIQQKYAWQMQTLMVDMRGYPRDFSREVLRSIRLFCREHNITLVREV